MQIKRWLRFILSLVLCLLFTAYSAYCSTYYVDPNGNDATGDGSIGNPWKTIPTAVTAAIAGDTIYLRGGTHPYTTSITISKSGTAGAKFYMFAYPGDTTRPILDFSSMAEASSNRGIKLSASYWYIKGIDIYRAGDNGMIIEQNNASYNRIELCNFYENRDSGLQLANGAAYNEIINCDSYYNRDAGMGNADGFSPKLTVGTGNYFYGCRSWNNSDDAYDAYLTVSNEVTTTYENCWAMKAGYLKDGSAGTGNGNGFKMGSSTNNHNAILKNCLAFQNLKKGFDQNNNKGSMTLYNCTGFNNGTYNYSIPAVLASGKTATLTNCISFTGSNTLGSFVVQTTNSWQSPFVVTSADFVSIDPSAAYGPRKADGSLPDITFMHLAAGSDLIDGGTNVGLPYNGSKPDLGCFETGGASPPGAASNPAPANGATGVSLTQDISWTAGSGATSHDVYFGTTNPPPFQINQTATSFDTGTMVYNTTYYWRIDEKNAGGTTTGTLWHFTTMADTTPPAAPTGLVVTSPGEANVPLDWNNNSEPDLAGYNVYRSATSGSGYSKLNVSLLTGSDYTDNIITHDTTYYYVVTAVDTTLNESGYSSEVFGGLYGDFTGNGIVEITDLPDFLDYWLQTDCGLTNGLDLDEDCIVDAYEFAVMAENWLK